LEQHSEVQPAEVRANIHLSEFVQVGVPQLSGRTEEVRRESLIQPATESLLCLASTQIWRVLAQRGRKINLMILLFDQYLPDLLG
jgi:hypothetical protein